MPYKRKYKRSSGSSGAAAMNKVARLLQAQTPSAIQKRAKAAFKRDQRALNMGYLRTALAAQSEPVVSDWQANAAAHGLGALGQDKLMQLMGRGGYWGRRAGAYLGGLTGNARMKSAFTDFGDQMGDVVADMIPYGNQIAAGAQAIAHMTGMGDYALGPQVASFAKDDMHRVNFKHREYLGAIKGTDAFSLTELVINPGNIQAFPRLSRLAMHFEQYQFRGLCFWYHSTSGESTLSANTNIGEVVTADTVDSSDPSPASKKEMMELPATKSSKPSVDLCHGIECKDSKILYIRHGTPNETATKNLDYDMGKFFLSVDGANDASTRIGELWVTYDIDLIRTRDSKGAETPAFRCDMTGVVTQTNLFAPALQNIRFNTLPLILTEFNNLTFPKFVTNGDYQIVLIFAGSPANAGFTVKAPLITGVTQGSILLNGAEIWNNESGLAQTTAVNRAVYGVRVNCPGTAQCVVTWDNTAQWSPFTTSGNFGITVSQVPTGFFDP